MRLTAGDRLGPYELLAPIGVGGMGEVWRARDTRIGRIVAIKRCSREFSGRFQREARAIAALNHPNICTLYDVGPDYLVMEYIEGAPPRGPLAPAEALPLAIGIATALEAAHQCGVVHRDLKPANVLVTRTGVKLLDFGLALLEEPAHEMAGTAGELTATGTVLGTVAYMSPEQAQGRPVDARSDIFAFGAVLYELVSGRQPFARTSAIDTLAAIVRDEPAPIDLPAGLAGVVGRCLKKAPSDRFQTMREVRAALEGTARDEVAATRPGAPPSIAVLPFANLSADKENEYFADGLAEEILNSLARIPGLKVIARTSSFAFRGKEQDITAIAAALRVQHVLEGSVRRAGARIRVTAQLVAAADGSHVWSERYDREMTDVFALQDDVSEAIATALRVRLAPRTRAANIEAYQHHLKGRYHLLRLSVESLAKARACFEQALAADPDYAPAHSALAEHYHSQYILGLAPADVMVPLARSAAEKALAIDADHSESHSILASLADTVDYRWDVAEAHHRRALAAHPATSIIRFRYATWHLLPLGRVDEAAGQIQVGLETDPLNVPLQYGMVLCHHMGRQHRQAIDYARQVLEIDATSHIIWHARGQAELSAGDPRAAVASFTRAVDLAPWWPAGIGSLAAACHLAGDRDRGQDLARSVGASPYGAAIYHAAAGNADAMVDALEAAWRQRNSFLPHTRSLALFEAYAADPRFQNLIARMKLSPSPSPPSAPAPAG